MAATRYAVAQQTQQREDHENLSDKGRLLEDDADEFAELPVFTPEDDQKQSWYLRRCSLPLWAIVGNAALFLVSVLLLMLSVYANRGALGYRNWLLKSTSQPSPILDQIDIPLVVKTMNGSLLLVSEAGTNSIYRRPPSPEVDAAWERIQTRGPVAISRADVIRMGKDPSDAVKYPEAFGLGPDAYVAKVDVFHQIHCLNTLRMNLHGANFAYYYGGRFPGAMPTNAFHDLHVSHCVQTLLENLMCAGNVELYTHVWVDAQAHPYADFDIRHTCRDFDAMLAWQEEHAVPLSRIGEFARPEDYAVHVTSHEFKEVLHWFDDHPPEEGDNEHH